MVFSSRIYLCLLNKLIRELILELKHLWPADMKGSLKESASELKSTWSTRKVLG